MGERFRITAFGEPRAPWRDARQHAVDDAVALGLASWDAAAKEWFIPVPAEIEKEGAPDPMRGYPSRAGRHREAWNEEDVRALRRLARKGDHVDRIAKQLQRSREACSTKARQLGISITPRLRR